jgi:2-oxoglutarate ferredoxin oxidoreductase subunit alpha
VVLAAVDAKDCAFITTQAFYISEKYQVPVLVLLDQFVGQRVETVPRRELLERGIEEGWIRRFDRATPTREELAENRYHRYKQTENGVSPMSFPGIEDADYIASGIEHNELGYPVSDVDVHRRMHAKRYKKLDFIKEEMKFMRHYGDPQARIGILCWGSSKGPARQAMLQAEAEGHRHPHADPRLPDAAPRGHGAGVHRLLREGHRGGFQLQRAISHLPEDAGGPAGGEGGGSPFRGRHAAAREGAEGEDQGGAP